MTGQHALLAHPEELVPTARPTATHHDFEEMEAQIASRVLPLAADLEAAPVQLTFRGQTVVALPMDTRRFVRLMARHLSMN